MHKTHSQHVIPFHTKEWALDSGHRIITQVATSQPFYMRLCNGVYEKNQHYFVIKDYTVVMNTFMR